MLIIIAVIYYLFQYNGNKLEGFYTFPVFNGTPLINQKSVNVTEVVQPLYKSVPIPTPQMWGLPPKHAKLNDFNGVDYVDDKPPCSRGEYGCRPVSCPSVFNENTICWKCTDIINEPQNMYYWE